MDSDSAREAVDRGEKFNAIHVDGAAGHIYEVALCEREKWVTILLRAEGLGGSWMTAGLSHSSNVILEQPYDSGVPAVGVQGGIAWAENKLKEMQVRFDNTYPWRIRS